MTTTEQVLGTACEILSDPSRWHQGYYHNDENTAWCALGVIQTAYHMHGMSVDIDSLGSELPAVAALEAVTRDAYPQFLGKNIDTALGTQCDDFFIPMWNDDKARKHAEVYEAFQKARAFAAEKGL